MKHFDGMSFPGTTCFNEIHSTFHCHIGSCLDFIGSLCSLSMQLNWRNFFTEKAIKKKKKDKKQIEASILPIFTHRDFFFVLIVVSPPKKS